MYINIFSLHLFSRNFHMTSHSETQSKRITVLLKNMFVFYIILTNENIRRVRMTELNKTHSNNYFTFARKVVKCTSSETYNETPNYSIKNKVRY